MLWIKRAGALIDPLQERWRWFTAPMRPRAVSSRTRSIGNARLGLSAAR